VETLRDAFDFKDLPGAEKCGFLLFTLFLLVFPWLGTGSFAKAAMIQFLLLSLLGMGWSVGGYGGQADLGKAQYAGVGAYAVALMATWWKIPFWISLPVGVLIALGYSFVIGFSLSRLKGCLFAMATFCSALLLQMIFLNWNLVGRTDGIDLGMRNTPRALFYSILGLFYAGIIYRNWFRKSKLGYQLRMIKEDEAAAESLGVDVQRCKVQAYCIASAMVAAGGGLMALHSNRIDPYAIMGSGLSMKIALVAMLGGSASLWGPLVGAAFLVPADLYLRGWLGDPEGMIGLDGVIYFGLIVLVHVLQPQGIWGIVRILRRRGA
jgi:branched-chain amino acid transport system permease protein